MGMVVVDPLDPGRNVAKNLYRLSHLRGVLQATHEALRRGDPLNKVINTRPETKWQPPAEVAEAAPAAEAAAAVEAVESKGEGEGEAAK